MADHSPRSRVANQTIGIASMAVLAYALCDVLHEAGHALAALAPLGVTAVSLSTVGVSTTGSSALVALAGPAANLVFSLFLLIAASPAFGPSWRWFAWLFGTVNLFNGAAYLLYSSVLGTGDWAVVFDTLVQPLVWRPVAGAVGLVCYAVSVWVALRVLRRMVASAVVAASHIDRYCATSYWIGGLLLTAGAAFNPVSPWLILTSGAATGFGAMVGLLLMHPTLRRELPSTDSASESLHIGPTWIGAAAVTAALFIGVLGPGVRWG